MHRSHTYIRDRISEAAETLKEVLDHSSLTSPSDDGKPVKPQIDELRSLISHIAFALETPERIKTAIEIMGS